MDFPLGPAAQLLALLAAQLVALLLAHLLAQLLWQLHTSVPGMGGRFLVGVPNPLALGSESGNLSRGFPALPRETPLQYCPAPQKWSKPRGKINVTLLNLSNSRNDYDDDYEC